MRCHLRRWGAAWILLVMWVVSAVLYGVFEMFAQITEAAQHGQVYSGTDFWIAYLSGTFENLQSEWAQLLVQAVLVVGLADRVFTRSTEDMARLTDEVVALRRRLDGH